MRLRLPKMSKSPSPVDGGGGPAVAVACGCGHSQRLDGGMQQRARGAGSEPNPNLKRPPHNTRFRSRTYHTL